MPNHSCPEDRLEVLIRVGRLRPVWPTVVVAAVLAEERADTFGTKIGDAVVTIARQNNRIGEDNLVLVDATLEIA